MGKTDLTKQLENAIQKEVKKPMGVFGCLEVTIGWYGKSRVDYMTMDSKEIFRCFEIKISKSDFHSKHGHNFEGHFNYYVMPKELYDEVKEEIPKEIGVYAWNGKYLNLIKRPKKLKLRIDKEILKNSLIRSLYRETSKIKDSENIELMNKLKNRAIKLESKNRELAIKNRDLEIELNSKEIKNFTMSN